MSILITGATGLIGSRLAVKLAEAGEEVRVLARPSAISRIPVHRGIRSFIGDIADPGSIENAMQGCTGVYHLAAFTGVWHSDPLYYHAINVEGTRKVLATARDTGVKSVVVTSTAGVLGPSANDQLMDEFSPPPPQFFTCYEESKAAMETMVQGFPSGVMRIVLVNPTRLYGPAPLTKPNSVTRMIVEYLQGRWRWLPGDGLGVGNYAFVDDVVDGHILAMEKGWHKARYILGGENLSYLDLFKQAGLVYGIRHRLYPVPVPLMLGAAGIMKGIAVASGKEPLITPGWVRKYRHSWRLTAALAEEKLGYRITPYAEGVKKIIDYFGL